MSAVHVMLEKRLWLICVQGWEVDQMDLAVGFRDTSVIAKIAFCI